jgi:hypothetical protein
MRPASTVLAAFLLCACPGQNSTPCATDADCTSSQRCRRGACGPICETDSDCGTSQVCRSGVCKPPPECVTDADCADRFTCTADRCQCIDDMSCQANQTCTSGTCVARKPCTGDADCAGTGKRCEITQGICLPICNLPQDCAPGLDPNVAFALYTCSMGTCTRRCLNDITCGGAGLICKADLCTKADCATISDCGPMQYCSSPTFGRCITYTTCSTTSDCMPNFECKTFTQGTCPPGFDCSMKICQELPTCLIDSDCVTLQGMPPMQVQTGYCAQGHCQQSQQCAGASCPTGQDCIASLCVPSTCRGLHDCPGSQECIDGACQTAPQPGDITSVHVRPQRATVEVGDTVQLQLVANRLGGLTYVMPMAAWSVAADGGTGAATVDATGLVTATAEGTVTVHGNVTGSLVSDALATITIYPHVTAGRRVIVVSAVDQSPLAGVRVQACDAGDCSAPSEVLTGADGVALFPNAASGPLTFTAVSPEIRNGDALPRWESASVLDTAAPDVYLPLRGNSVHAGGGISGTISFSDVTTSGQYWAGFSAVSFSDVPAWDPQFMLGDNFFVALPGLMQTIPVPASVVLYTSPGFGIPMDVKTRSLANGQAGPQRHAIAFAGRTDAAIALSLRSTDFLSYLGAFDYALALDLPVTQLAMTADTTDVNNNGLCSNMTKCPMGTEDVPDYANFTPSSFAPQRQQNRRTEVVVPNLPSTLNQVVVTALELSVEGGAVPTGFASATGGAPGADGTRPVSPVVLRSGPAYGGLETATPGVLVLGASTNGNSSSARITQAPVLAARTLVAPFLPVPEGSTYSGATRIFSPGQPQWASVYSTGGQLARVSISGTQTRHTIYFAVQGTQTAIALPPMPIGPGKDPTTEAQPTLDVVTIDLVTQVPSVDDAFTLSGANLGTLERIVDGYSRYTR